MVKKLKTIDSFFKRQSLSDSDKPPESSTDESRPFKVPRVESKEVDNNEGGMPLVSLVDDQRPSETPRVESKGVDGNGNYLERDPGLCCQIWEYPSNVHDEIRRAYIKAGPYQFLLSEYPFSGPEYHPRRFQSSWFK